MAELGRDSGRDRSVTKGVELMADQWRSGKAQAALIESEVASFEHVPCQRKKASGGFEDGFLVAGSVALTFLAQDGKSVISSHPLAFLEVYGQDESIDNLFNYSLKQRHMMKRGDMMSFSFMLGSSERVQFIVNSIDRYSLSGGTKDKPTGLVGKLAPRSPRSSVGMPKRASTGPNKAFPDLWDGTFADVNNPNDTFDTKEKFGTRFVGQRSFVSATAQRGEALKEERIASIAIINRVGIALLTYENERGMIQHFEWSGIKSFGAAGTDCFGFKITNKKGEEEFAVFYTGESAHKMDALAAKMAKANESLQLDSERDRSRTVGVEIMKVGLLGGKATQQATIMADVKSFDHIKCARKKKSSEETQPGFIVVGSATVTFLSNSKEIILSHPLGFLESYYLDPQYTTALTYTLKQKSALKRGKTLSFTFLLDTPENAEKALESLDRYIFSSRATSGGFVSARPNKRLSGSHSPRGSGTVSPRIGSQRSSQRLSGTPQGAGASGFAALWDGQFRDLAVPADPIPTVSIKGIRHIGQRSTLNSVTNALGPKSLGICVINEYGITIFQCNSQKGTIESHPWRSIKSFGVAGSDVFGFQTTGAKSGSEEYICFVTEDSALVLDQLAHRYLDEEGIATSEGRARTETRGIEVMTDGWMTEKTRNSLIEQDVKNFEHRAVQRKRTTQDGFEQGFLVVGIAAITFLGPDSSVLASHPLSFLEAYAQDLQDDTMLTYTLKRSRSVSSEDPLTFKFKMNSADQVKLTIAAIDRNSYFKSIPNADGSGVTKPALALPAGLTVKVKGRNADSMIEAVFRDKSVVPEMPALPDGSDAPEMPALPPATFIEGQRVCCVKTFMSGKKMSVISSAPKENATAIFNARGILFLQADFESGVLEPYLWQDVLSFGATGDDCFGFKVTTGEGEEGFVCCYTAQSGHLMNVLAKKCSKLSEHVQADAFPKEYAPQ